MTADYSEYPKTMAHPAFEKAKSLPIPGTEIKDALGNIVSQSYQGTPEHFPPVTVSDPTQEEYYKAQGYQDAGHADPAAWVKAHSDGPPESYVPQEYPKWVGDKLVNDAAEEAELTLTLEEYSEKYLKPAAARLREENPELAARVDAEMAIYSDGDHTIETLEARLKVLKDAKAASERSEKAKRAWETRRANKEAADEQAPA